LVIKQATEAADLTAVVHQRYRALYRIPTAPAYAVVAQQSRPRSLSTVYYAFHHNTNIVVGSVETLVRGAPTHDLYIANLVVTPSFRRLGVASALLDTVIASSSFGAPVKPLTLTVDDDNAAAIRLYETKGFEHQAHAVPAKRTLFFITLPSVRPRHHDMVYNPQAAARATAWSASPPRPTWGTSIASLWAQRDRDSH
jgi:GNAT superfamily N-acetyltransferase